MKLMIRKEQYPEGVVFIFFNDSFVMALANDSVSALDTHLTYMLLFYTKVGHLTTWGKDLKKQLDLTP